MSAGASALGPVGIAAAAVSAIPSIISLFSSTTTVTDHVENITDLATTTAVVSALLQTEGPPAVVHEDFRLAPRPSSPPDGTVAERYEHLSMTRMKLLFKQERLQVAKNEADQQLAEAQAKQTAQQAAKPPKPADPDVAKQIFEQTASSADAAARLSLISSAVSAIDALTGAVNATAAGTRSPLAAATLNESLHNHEIDYVLSVKGLGGQSTEYTKDRHIGFDTYTTLADASIAYMLYELKDRKLVSAGVAVGVSSVHGQLGKPPEGLDGVNARDAVDDQTKDNDAKREGRFRKALDDLTGDG